MIKIEAVNNGFVITKNNPLPQYAPSPMDVYVFHTADELGDFIKNNWEELFKPKEK